VPVFGDGLFGAALYCFGGDVTPSGMTDKKGKSSCKARTTATAKADPYGMTTKKQAMANAKYSVGLDRC